MDHRRRRYRDGRPAFAPFYWVLVGSFMTPAELSGINQTLWPRHFVVENWSKALEPSVAARSK